MMEPMNCFSFAISSSVRPVLFASISSNPRFSAAILISAVSHSARCFAPLLMTGSAAIKSARALSNSFAASARLASILLFCHVLVDLLVSWDPSFIFANVVSSNWIRRA